MKRPFNLLLSGNTSVLSLLLLALVAGVFLPSLHNGFVNLDDNVYVYENAHVQGGFKAENIRWAFATGEGGLWHPLTWLSLMLDRQLLGPQAGGYHLTALLLHALNTVLLFVALCRMTGARWRSCMIAALFAIHPLHVESVAWIAERKDVLSTFFWMLTLLMYLRYVENVKNRKAILFYALTAVCFTCGLMSKAMVVSLPFVLLLLDWWPLRRLEGHSLSARDPALRLLILEKIPLVVAALGFSIVAWFTQRTAGAMESGVQLTAVARLGNAVLSYARYLVQTVWPVDLAVYYPFPRELPHWQVVLAALLVLSVTLAVLREARRRPWLAVGWLWYVVTLLPVIGLIQIGAQAHADRYTYVPLIGIFILAVWGFHELTRRWRQQRACLSIAAVVAIAVSTALTRRQIGFWKNSETLFARALAVTHENGLAHNNLGAELTKQGRLDQAIFHLEQAVRLMPSYADAHDNLAAALGRQGRVAEAITHLEQALRCNPNFVEAHNNLGVILGMNGRFDEAIAQLKEAIRLRPGYAEAHYNLGNALAFKGRFDEAIIEYEAALKLKADDADSHNKLAQLLVMSGRFENSIAHYREAIRLNPELVDARCGLGVALIRTERFDEALNQLQAALKVDPNSAEAHCNLGIALAGMGRFDEGLAHLLEAVRLKPDYADAHSNRAIALRLKAAVATPANPP